MPTPLSKQAAGAGATHKARGLRDIDLSEFSLLREVKDDHPAAPGAVVVTYKSNKAGQAGPQGEDCNRGRERKGWTMPTALKKAIDAILELAGAGAPAEVEKRQTTTEWQTERTMKENTTVVEDDGLEEIMHGQAEPAGKADGEGGEPAAPAKKQAPLRKAAGAEGATGAVQTYDNTDVAKALQASAEVMKVLAQGQAALVERIDKLEGRPAQSGRILASGSGGQKVEKKFPGFTEYLERRFNVTAGQRLTKSGVLSGNFAYGLTAEEADRFIDYIVDQKRLLSLVRLERMNKNTKNINAIAFTDKILRAGVQAVDPGPTVGITVSQIQLTSKEVIAEVFVPDDVLEDNIEGDAFVNHLLQMIAKATNNELEEAALIADISGGVDGILNLFDGYYTLAKAGDASVTEAMADDDRYWPGLAGYKATALLNSLDEQYTADEAMLAFIQNGKIYRNVLDVFAGRETAMGDNALTGAQLVTLKGVRNVRAPKLPNTMAFSYGGSDYTNGTFIMLTDLRNLIWGIERDIRVESQREARERGTYYVVTMRCDFQIENTAGVGIYDHALVSG